MKVYLPLFKTILLYTLLSFSLNFVQAQCSTADFQWAKTFGGTSSDQGIGITTDANGNVFTTGYFNGTVDFDPTTTINNLTANGSNDIFISKLDKNGNFLWAKAIGGTSFDRGYGISTDANGNVYTTGYFNGTVDFDPNAGVTNLTANGDKDVFILKLDNNGNFVWAKAFGGSNYDFGYDITTDTNGNIYTTGYFSGTVDFDPSSGINNLTSIGSYDVFILKLDANGNFDWAKAIGGSGYDKAEDITTDANGNVYTTGYVNGLVDFDPNAGVHNLTAYGGDDVFILKLDTNGNFVWAKAIGGTAREFATGITTDTIGNIFTTGGFQGTADFDPNVGVHNLTSNGMNDIFISKLDSNGNFVWAKAIGGIDNDFGYGITTNESVYTTGSFTGTADFDPDAGVHNLTSNGYYDGFILKLSQCVFSMSITAQTNLSCNGNSSGSLTVTSVHGGPNYAYAWSNGSTTSSGASTTNTVSNLSAGTYTVTVTDMSGLSKTASATITEPTLLVASSIVDEQESCLNTMDGQLTASATGGTPPYSYAWSTSTSSVPFATTATINGLTASAYTVTVTDANGCTAIINDTIIHKLATTNTVSYTACDSMVSPSGIYTWNTSGAYIDTLVNSIGCDSILMINLTINASSTSTQTITACNNYTAVSGTKNWTSSGVYSDTIPNAVGCDSVLTINLTINTFTTSHQTITACNQYASPSGSFSWTVSGTYHEVIPNAAGCDSLMTIDLTIIHSSDSTISIETCNTYSGVSGNQNWTTSGVYADTVPNSAGCDSVITINLIVNNAMATTIRPEICAGDSFQVGSNWYATEGTYMDTLATVAGCDSVVTTMLSVETVDVSVTELGSGWLRADNSFATYQWVNCDSNYAFVPGATNNRFEPTATGNYAVIVSTTNCSDTSDCYYVNILGVKQISDQIDMEVYPNPAGADKSTVTVKVNNVKDYELNIRDLAGKLIYSEKNIIENTNFIDVTKFAAGTYFIEVSTDDFKQYQKLIVQ